MVAVLKPSATKEQIDNLTQWLEGRGLKVHISKGEFHTIIGLIGDTRKIDTELLESLEMVNLSNVLLNLLKAQTASFTRRIQLLRLAILKSEALISK